MHHLLLGAQKAFLEAAAVADAQRAAGLLECGEDRFGVVERERERLFHQHGLAELQRLADRRGVLAFGRRDEYGGHFRARDHLVIVGGMEVGAGRLGQGFAPALGPCRKQQGSEQPDALRQAAHAACQCGPSRQPRCRVPCAARLILLRHSDTRAQPVGPESIPTNRAVLSGFPIIPPGFSIPGSSLRSAPE